MNKNLEIEYKKYVNTDLPDLWSRIEASLPDKNINSQDVNNNIDSVKSVAMASEIAENVLTPEQNNVLNFKGETYDGIKDVLEKNIEFDKSIESDVTNNNTKNKKKNIKPIIISLSCVAAAALLILVMKPILENNTDRLESAAPSNAATVCDEAECGDAAAEEATSMAASDEAGFFEDEDYGYGTDSQSAYNSELAETETYHFEEAIPSHDDSKEDASAEKVNESERDSLDISDENEAKCEDMTSEETRSDEAEYAEYEYGEQVLLSVRGINIEEGCVYAEVTLLEGLGDILSADTTITVDATKIFASTDEETIAAFVDTEISWFLYLENDVWYADISKPN